MTTEEIAECRLDELNKALELGNYWRERAFAAEAYMYIKNHPHYLEREQEERYKTWHELAIKKI